MLQVCLLLPLQHTMQLHLPLWQNIMENSTPHSQQNPQGHMLLTKNAHSTQGHYQSFSQSSLMPPPPSRYEQDQNLYQSHGLLPQKNVSDTCNAQQYMAFYNRGTPPTHPHHVGTASIHSTFNSILITKVSFDIKLEKMYVLELFKKEFSHQIFPISLAI